MSEELARIIREELYPTRRYTAQSVIILFPVCFPPSRLHAPSQRFHHELS
jgi:hypothetical protein